MSYPKIYSLSCYVVNNEVPSTSSQIVEQFQVIQEVVLPGYYSWMTKHQTRNEVTKHNFLQKSLQKKENGYDVAYYICYHTN